MCVCVREKNGDKDDRRKFEIEGEKWIDCNVRERRMKERKIERKERERCVNLETIKVRLYVYNYKYK